jgi:formylglycine-generating enzyme required for sulfatase activity
VSRDDAEEFVARLSACGERQYRLPTEAEWEYCCRAGADLESPYWFEEKQIDEFAWHLRNTVPAGEKYAHPVGQKKPNPWGLFDMAGNVHEWCYDRFSWSYWRGEPKTDPVGPEQGSAFVLRGGSFYYSSWALFNYPRSRHRTSYRNFDAGFRVVRLAP